MSSNIVVDLEAAAFARQALLKWFATSSRSFPWRDDPDPYHILIAEMMLRRTQARQVEDVYNHFITRFPDVRSLDQAPEEEILKLVYPLGLDWRAANFKKLAHEVAIHHEGNVPRDRKALLNLTGVGPYVADAVRCFAFGELATVMDTNTVRVAARYFGFSFNPESRRRVPVIRAVSTLIDSTNPASSNYALLDFAAIVCRSRDPDHSICPLAPRCAYLSKLHNLERKD
jgi:A/G-specific adenine glycosylase